MKKPLFFIAILSLVLSACCDKVSDDIELPEANDENCKTANMRKLGLTKHAQNILTDRCMMRYNPDDTSLFINKGTEK